MSKYNSILLISSIFLLLTSCTKSDNLSEWKYNFVVRDVVTNESVENVDLRLLQHFGGSLLLHESTTETNSNGEASITSLIDEDSLAVMLEENMFDPSVVWQELFIDSPYFLLQNIVQGGTEFPFIRKNFEQEVEITVYVWKAGRVFLKFEDEINPDKYNNVTLAICATHDNTKFQNNIGNYGNQSDMWTLRIPSDRDVKFEWEIYEGDDYSQTELVDNESVILNIGFQEDIMYTIIH